MCSGTIAWCDFTWEAFATLITGLSAVGGAVWVGSRQVIIQQKQAEIQLRQTQLQEAELRSELFDRRYRVYERVKKFMTEILQKADDPEEITQREYLVAMGESRFLFHDNVRQGLDEIWENWTKFHVLKVTMKRTYDLEGHYGEGNPDREYEALKWFNERFKTLPELFDELRLSTQVNA